jgi:hypothetical protein
MNGKREVLTDMRPSGADHGTGHRIRIREEIYLYLPDPPHPFRHNMARTSGVKPAFFNKKMQRVAGGSGGVLCADGYAGSVEKQ